MMAWWVFTCYELGLLVCINMPLTNDHYIALLVTICNHSQNPCIPTMMDYSYSIMHNVMRTIFSTIHLTSILEIFSKWYHQTWVQLRIMGCSRERDLFICKILLLQISGKLWTTVKKGWFNIYPEVYLWNSCHVKLLHITGLNEFTTWFLAC